MNKKIAVVTGATGMIGHRLCQHLQKRGWYVVALCRCKIGRGPWDEIIEADVTQKEQIILPAGTSVVFHLAGKAHALAETFQDVAEYFAVNTEGTRHMLDAASQVGAHRFILFSSIKAMGEGGEAELDESAPCNPLTPYGKSKLAAEHLVLHEGLVTEPIVLRLSMVYGMAGKGNLPRMIEAVSKGRFPPLPEVGNKRSMVHVDDVVQAALLAAEKAEAVGQAFIVTDGKQYSTRQIYAWICEALGKPLPRWSIPLPMLRALAVIGDWICRLRRARVVFDSVTLEKLTGSAAYSCAKLKSRLGYQPERDLYRSLLDSDMGST